MAPPPCGSIWAISYFMQSQTPVRCARSQGSAPWQTQVIALGVPLLEHFPLDPVSYLQYKTSINLTLWYAAWRRHGTTVCARQHRLAISLYPAGLGTDPAYRASLCARPT